MESVERETTLPEGPDEAWARVADLEGWFASEVEGEIALGEVVRIDGRRAVIERVDAPERLTFRWLGTDPSRVDITLEPTPAKPARSEGDNGTIVHVEETRIEPAVTPVPEIGFKALART